MGNTIRRFKWMAFGFAAAPMAAWNVVLAIRAYRSIGIDPTILGMLRSGMAGPAGAR